MLVHKTCSSVGKHSNQFQAENSSLLLGSSSTSSPRLHHSQVEDIPGSQLQSSKSSVHQSGPGKGYRRTKPPAVTVKDPDVKKESHVTTIQPVTAIVIDSDVEEDGHVATQPATAIVKDPDVKKEGHVASTQPIVFLADTMSQRQCHPMERAFQGKPINSKFPSLLVWIEDLLNTIQGMIYNDNDVEAAIQIWRTTLCVDDIALGSIRPKLMPSTSLEQRDDFSRLVRSSLKYMEDHRYRFFTLGIFSSYKVFPRSSWVDCMNQGMGDALKNMALKSSYSITAEWDELDDCLESNTNVGSYGIRLEPLANDTINQRMYVGSGTSIITSSSKGIGQRRVDRRRAGALCREGNAKQVPLSLDIEWLV